MELLNNKTGHNVYNEIKMLLYNVPDDLSEIELIRWLYIKIGMLFNYDYRILADPTIGERKVDFDSEYISNYQTCYQICEIMNKVFNHFGIKSKTIERKTPNKIYDYEHAANIVELSTGEKYLLDLTVDLYLIQSGCQTHEFGTCNEEDSDTISNSRLEAIDERLNLITYGEYTDKKIRDKKSVINGFDYSNMTYDEELIYKIEGIKELIPLFIGYNEARLYINKLLNDFNIPFHKYNLMYKNDDISKMIECILIYGDDNIWYLYAGNTGLIKTDAKKLSKMLEHGWYSKNDRFNELLEEELSINIKK